MRSLVPVLLLALTLAACAPATDGEIAPPEIRYGEDICEVCGMIISEARFATACVTSDDEGHGFDGVGEMLIFIHQHHEGEIRQCFVHDYDTEVWLTVDNAYYVISENVHTPMGFGIVAFETSEQAETLATDTSGMVHTWEEVLTVEIGSH